MIYTVPAFSGVNHYHNVPLDCVFQQLRRRNEHDKSSKINIQTPWGGGLYNLMYWFKHCYLLNNVFAYKCIHSDFLHLITKKSKGKKNGPHPFRNNKSMH